MFVLGAQDDRFFFTIEIRRIPVFFAKEGFANGTGTRVVTSMRSLDPSQFKYTSREPLNCSPERLTECIKYPRVPRLSKGGENIVLYIILITAGKETFIRIAIRRARSRVKFFFVSHARVTFSSPVRKLTPPKTKTYRFR